MIERWEIVRLFLRWQVNLVSEFPNGVAGVRVRPFRHPQRRFWRWSSAVKYARERAALADKSTEGDET